MPPSMRGGVVLFDMLDTEVLVSNRRGNKACHPSPNDIQDDRPAPWSDK